MGVKDLWQIIKPTSRPITLQELSGKTLAIDLGQWIVQMNKIDTPNLYMRNLFYRTVALLSHNVNLVFVLEGEAPKLKAKVIQQRLEQYRLNDQPIPSEDEDLRRPGFLHMLHECEKMLEMFGVRCITSGSEAEAMCAQLNRFKVVDGCVTCDSDVFLYGANEVYRNFTISKNSVMEAYSMEEIESRIGVTREKMVALAVLLGCDYLLKGVPGVGKEKAMKLLTKESSECILQRFQQWLDPNFGKVILEKKEMLKTLKHCSSCQHLGIKRNHTSQGCVLCGTNNGCNNKSGIPCNCSYHSNPVSDLEEIELYIRNRALKVENFPCKDVTNEYLNYKDSWPEDLPRRRRPKFHDMKEYFKERFRWPYEKYLEKILPVILSWDIYCLDKNITDSFFFYPDSILSKRRSINSETFQIRWKVVDKSVLLPDEIKNIDCPVEASIISRALPELLAKFDKDGGSSKLKKDSPKKRKSGYQRITQSKITDSFKMSKKMEAIQTMRDCLKAQSRSASIGETCQGKNVDPCLFLTDVESMGSTTAGFRTEIE